MKRKYLLLPSFIFVTLLLGNCNLPRVTITQATDTPIPSTATQDVTPTPSMAELGQAENPVILALPPSANSPEQINAAHEIAAQFTARTGYVVAVVAPDSYAALVEAFANGNAHIAVLDPLSYALAYQENLTQARYAVLKEGEYKYGSQFIAAQEDGYTSYIEPLSGVNTADANVALEQFRDKKPCWSEETSPSGYIVPLGILNQNLITTKPAAFMGGQPTVVRSLYAGNICDFGATYIDARKFPSLEDEMPDLLEKVIVIWETPKITPYEVMVFSNKMPQSMIDLFATLVPAIMQTDTGGAAFKTAYDIEELQAVNDADFADYHTYVKESQVDLSQLLDQ